MAQRSEITARDLHGRNIMFGDHSHVNEGSSGGSEKALAKPARKGKGKKIFVIHGRDAAARDAVFEVLRALGLKPQEWEHLVKATGSATPSLADVLDRAVKDAQAVVALLTPDDIVQLHPDLRSAGDSAAEQAAGCQPRPNVYLELGMALAVMRERTIILEAGTIRRSADLSGLNYVTIDESIQWCNKLAQRLENAGCPVDRSGTDWHEPRRFTGLAAYRRRCAAGTDAA
ncbi:TIR domain-containing protein [Actinoplanes sp. DH11]|uniref:TIR domain-containing protein n=1 Tax=Actinoplanes sp. DH11 TaxID=2857011 RepID=UPI001E3A3AFF|nr:nucleotide-binding protein [Actinoplanes sp. DH11]